MSRHDHGHASLLEAFSAMTLELQRLAQDKDIEHFHEAALSCIRQLLALRQRLVGPGCAD